MAFSNQVYGIISQVGEQIYQRQDKKREKANTWVVGIGTVIAAIAAAVGFLLEANVDWAPEWLPTIGALLAMIGTLFGVSRTKNGVTKSVLEQLNSGIADMIDEQKRDAGHPGIPDPVVPVTTTPDVDDSPPVGNQDSIADSFDDLARRIARR